MKEEGQRRWQGKAPIEVLRGTGRALEILGEPEEGGRAQVHALTRGNCRWSQWT